MENTLTRKKQIITAKALTTVIGITLSVAIPQLFHVIGMSPMAIGLLVCQLSMSFVCP